MLDEAAATKREGPSQLLIYIHHPVGSISINPDEPLVPASASLSIVQVSIASIQNVTGLSVLAVSLYQPPSVEDSGGQVNIAAIVGGVIGGTLFVAALLLLLILVILIM